MEHDATAPVVGSLFSGVGGLDLGFAWAGFRHAFFAEVDPYCRAVIAARWPGVPIYEDVADVGRVEPPSIGLGADHGAEHGAVNGQGISRVDVIAGGFPCQDLSVAGKRAGLGGERSGLFWEAMRVVDALCPRAIVLENVEGLYTSNGGRDFGVVLDALAARGYVAAWRTLDAQFFGVPQRRRRVFVVGVLDGDIAARRIGEVFAFPESSRGDSPTSDPAWPLTSRGIADGAASGGGGLVGALTGRSPSRLDEQCVGGGQLVVSPAPSPRATGSRPDRTSARPVQASSRVTTSPPQRERERTSGERDYVHDSPRGRRLHGAGGALDCRQRGVGVNPSNEDVAGTLPSNTQGGQRTTDISGAYVVGAYRKSARVNADPTSAETWVEDGKANTLNRFDVGDVRTTHAVVSVSQNQRGEVRESDVAPAVTNGGGKPGQGYSAVRSGPTVRRLTPLECERLMGWPDGWTDVPWNGKDHAPDTRRYQACGNGVVAPVAYWIAARLREALS